jgi:hypothetical protein
LSTDPMRDKMKGQINPAQGGNMPLFNKKPQAPDLSGLTMEKLLFMADTETDPVLIHSALSRAEELAPDDLGIQRRLLLLGRLYLRSNKVMDFSVIKSWLLHAFEHPDKHVDAEAKRMARELFDEPRLKRCLELAPDKAAFLRDYHEELSRDYIRIFIAADNTHVPRVFGISFKGNLSRYLAIPSRDIISNILASPWLSEEESVPLAKAFYRAFYDHVHGEVRELDRLLGAEICGQLK